MATITAIKQQQKRTNRYSIYVDGGYAFSLSEDQLVASGLSRGQQLSSDELEAWDSASLYGKALQAAYNLLSFRSRSRYEMNDRLTRKGYDEPTINRVLAHLSDIGLINDDQFTKGLLAQPKSINRSRWQLTSELRKKGIDRDTSDQALSELDPNHEYEATKNLIKKQLDKNTPPDKAHLLAYLGRRGFRPGLVLEVLNQEFSDYHLPQSNDKPSRRRMPKAKQ